MAQWRIDQQKKVEQNSKTLYELGMIATVDGNPVSNLNPLPVTLGNIMGANINIYNQVDLLAVNTNIIPATDNIYSLGNTSNRWSSVHIGPGTLYIEDQSNAALNAALTVNNGVLQIDGANQLQVGQLKFVNNTIESATGGVDIQIGLTDSTANLVLNRNTILASGKSFGLVDAVTSNTATLTVSNSVLVVSGSANGIRVGDIEIYGDTIDSSNDSANFKLGSPVASANLVIGRSMVMANNKTITFSDNTTQSTAYKAPNVRIDAAISNTVLIDFASDNIIHVHTNAGTLTANIQNLSSGAGRSIELFIFNNIGGTQQFNHSLRSGTQATGGQSFYLSTHNLMYVKYFCLDGNTYNTFVTAIV